MTKKSVEGIPIMRLRSAGGDLGAGEHYFSAPSIDGSHIETKGFNSTTPGLLELVQWLRDRKITHVAMESTGVYWIPPFEVLESAGFEVTLASSRQLLSVSGRKSDIADCQWIQRLHACGLLPGSFRPADKICALRAIVRQAANYMQLQVEAVQWMQKALDQMNIAVHRAVSDVTGVTGMKIIRAIVAGERDPKNLAEFRDKRCKKSKQEICDHLTGNWRDEHLFNLIEAVHHWDNLGSTIARYEAKVMELLKALSPPEPGPAPVNPKAPKEIAIAKKGNTPLRDALFFATGYDLTTVDGINVRGATSIFSEVGWDLSKFPTEAQFISWLRLCPRNPSSGGKLVAKKKRSTGSSRLNQTFRSAAVSLRNADCALGAEYRRIAAKKGAGTAAFAIARKIAQLVYRILRYGQAYADIGVEAYERKQSERRLKRMHRQADELGYDLVPKVKTA